MLMLTFAIGNEHFATAAAGVEEIVPLVALRPIPMSEEPWLAGVFAYRGQMTPVVDLCRMTGKGPCVGFMSTRIMVVRHSSGRPVGLMAERMTRMVELEPQGFQDTGVDAGGADFLGGVCQDGETLVQWVDPDRLLPPRVAARLFRRCAESAPGGGSEG